MRRRPLGATRGTSRSMHPRFSTMFLCFMAANSTDWCPAGVSATDAAGGHDSDAMTCPCEPWKSPLPGAATCLLQTTKSPTALHHDVRESNWLKDGLMDGSMSPLLSNTTTLLDFLNQPTDWAEVRAHFKSSVVATWEAVAAWVYLARLLSIPVLSGLLMVVEALLPHTRSLVHSAYLTFRSLDPVNQANTVVVVVLLIVTWRKGYLSRMLQAWRRFKARWRQAQRSLRHQIAAKSRVAAYVLPHVIYALVCHIVATFSPAAVLAVLSHDLLFTWLSTVYPIYSSIRAVRRHRFSDQPATASLEQCLRYWIVWAFFLTIHSVIATFLPRFVFGFIRPSPLRVNFLLNWVHTMDGTFVLYRFVANYCRPPHPTRPDAVANRALAAIEGSAASTGIVFRTLTAVGLISTRTANILGDVMAQGPAAFGLVFLTMPGFLTNVGCNAVALAFPAYVVVGTLARNQRRTHEWWVCYFTVVAVVEYFFNVMSGVLAWVPFAYHAKLVGMLYLQFPYFRGAQKLFDLCFTNVFIDPRREDAPPRSLELQDPSEAPSNVEAS